MNLGCSYFFSSTEPHIALILFLYFGFKFRLSYSTCQNFARQFLKLLPHLVDKLSFDIFMVTAVHLCFPNLDRNFLYWFKPWLFLFCSYFPVNLEECIVICLLSFNNICMFFCSILWPVFTRLFRIIIAYIESKN